MAASAALLHAKVAGATALGALKLDNYTFEKALAIPGQSYLVKFDKSYAYGEKEDEFKTLSKLAHTVPNFFVAEVPVQEFGDKDNEDLANKYNLKKDDFPAYLLFNEANQAGMRYEGAVKVDSISPWLRKQGIMLPALGTIDELDTLAKKFLEDKADEHIQAVKALASDQYKNDRKAPMYVKIMEKVKEKGDGYINTEKARVNKILEGKLSEEKKAELSDKLKILNVLAKDEL